MTDVRLDSNGVPKAAVFDAATPVVHRSGVSAVDVSEPDVEDGVDASGYERIAFDLDITLGGTTPGVEVAPTFYDATADHWFRGDSAFYGVNGRYRLDVEARGALVFLEVVALTGTSPTLDLDVWA